MEITFRLEKFEGPLDLLLHLIAQNKVSVDDIPIALILEQYLAYLERMSSLEIEITSDFIVMAAKLILIKSRMLLPSGEEEEEDPRLELARRLAEYRLFKDMSGVLSGYPEATGELWPKPPEPEPAQGREYGYSHSAPELIAALRAVLERGEAKKPPRAEAFAGIVAREGGSIEEAAVRVLSLLAKNGRMTVHELLRRAGSRSAAVAAFLALLDLCRERRIDLDDENTFVGLHPGPAEALPV